jgi:hypothetical protein
LAGRRWKRKTCRTRSKNSTCRSQFTSSGHISSVSRHVPVQNSQSSRNSPVQNIQSVGTFQYKIV